MTRQASVNPGGLSMGLFDKCEDTGKLIVRLAVGVLLLLHGISKLKSGVDWLTPMLADHGLPAFIRYGVYVGEVVAPILLIIGLFSRPAGLVLAINMIVAVLLTRPAEFFALDPQGGGSKIELELLFALGGVAVWCLGAGKYSVSRGRGKWD
jgi:putative oxidoreductase